MRPIPRRFLAVHDAAAAAAAAAVLADLVVVLAAPAAPAPRLGAYSGRRKREQKREQKRKQKRNRDVVVAGFALMRFGKLSEACL